MAPTNAIINGQLTFIGASAGQVSVQAQTIGQSYIANLPNTIPNANQLLSVLSVNGNVVTLGWAAAQSSTVQLSQLSTAGATSGDVIQYNGTSWAVSASVPGSGTVTSVALTAPAEFTVGGSPITGAGTLAITKATQAANTVWAGPASAGPTAPTFRALVVADIPALPYLAAATQLPVTFTPVANEFLTGYTSGTGLFTAAQASFAGLSGSIATGQIPASTITIAQINSKRGNGTFVQLSDSNDPTTNGNAVTYDANGNTHDSGTLLSSLATTASLASYALLTGASFTGGVFVSDVDGYVHLADGNGGRNNIAEFNSAGDTAGVWIDTSGNLYPRQAIFDSTGVPGTSGQVLSSTVTGTLWVTSSATPGGSSGDIQYNNSGAFGGSAATISGAGSITIPSGQTLTVQDIENQTGHQLSISILDASNFAVNGASSSQILVSGAGAITLTTTTTNAITLATATGSFQFFGTGGGMTLGSQNSQIAIDASGNISLGATGGSNLSVSAAGGLVTSSAFKPTQLYSFPGNTAGTTGQLFSSTGTGTAWITNPSPVLSDGAGNPPSAGDNHIASGTATITTGSSGTITLTGAAVFSDTNYVIQISRTNTPGGTGTGQLWATITDGANFTISSSDATDSSSTLVWTAIGF